MSNESISWEEFRGEVKNCQFNCPRINEKFKILFNREKTSLANVKFIVVSQEPGFSLKKEHDFKNTEEVEEYLKSECLKEPDGRATIINRLKSIFNKKQFDPTTKEIYWTHALKCVPKESDKDIKKDWKACASVNCSEHFKKELSIIPAKKLILIPFGNYALTLCRNIVEEEKHPLNKIGGILKYITSFDSVKEFTFKEKKILLFPFLHPSNRNRNKTDEIEAKEKMFSKKIHELLKTK